LEHAGVHYLPVLEANAVLDVIVELHDLLHVRAPGLVHGPLALLADDAAEVRGPHDEGLRLPSRHLVLIVHVSHRLGVSAEDGRAVAALEALTDVHLLHVSLKVGVVEVIIAVTALDLIRNNRVRRSLLRWGP